VATRHSVITDDEESDDFELEEDEELEEGEEEEESEEGETEQSGRPTSQVNWEERFKGLQATVQQSQETVQRLRQEKLMAEATAIRSHLASQNLDPEVAESQFRLWLQSKANEFAAQQNASDRDALEHVSRVNYLRTLVEEFGIDTNSKSFERLSRIKDPEDMREFAQEIAEMKKASTKQTTKAVRKTKGADKFDSGGGRVGTPPKQKAKSLDDAAAIFAKYKVEF
jgi:hypothetical protein